jgi:ATP-dependent DNA helicase Q1
MSASDGKIRTGVYHSEVKDHEKEVLHKHWRQGEIEVVCATIGNNFDHILERSVL